MNFVFEDKENYLNFIKCSDVNPSGIKRFAPSPTAVTILHRTQLGRKYDMSLKPKPYIIATGVNHHPNDWAGSPLAYNNTRRSALSYLHNKQLKDLQSGKAMVLFDQCLEGYHAPWLWQYFHDDCQAHGVDPSAIIYITGNSLTAEQYDKWATANNVERRLTTITNVHFEADVYNNSIWDNVNVNVDTQLEYKQTHTIADFNCLQKRLRPHRIWFYIKLFEEGLLNNGLVRMNPFNVNNVWLEDRRIPPEQAATANSILPLLVHGTNNNEKDDGFYIRRIQADTFLDSWVSLISEASFSDNDQQLFLSEKIFKPIACHHPFIIVGNRGSLKELKKMGYRTFEGFIDESYDDLPTFERFDAIVESVKKIIAIEDKFVWYEGMREILEHNYNVLRQNSTSVNTAVVKVQSAYNTYFNLG